MSDAKSQRPLTVYMVGNAHIDPVWLWTVGEGRAEVLNTYRTAIMLIHEFEGYVFSSGGAATYKWVQQDDPKLFAEIKQAVARGQWAIVNGWMIQPDCNIPSGESFARHALYAQRYFGDILGKRARVGYNVDSFGHAGTLPQILKLSGLDYYLFCRPGRGEKTLPDHPFWWEAPDGTRVLTLRPPTHYNSPGDGRFEERLEFCAKLTPADMPMTLCFYGVGNHGGGPTRADVRSIAELHGRGGALRPVFASPERYFSDVEAIGRDWPVVHDELQHHARGCYAAVSRMKSGIRAGEHALMRAERLATLAALLCDGPNRQPQLQDAWEKLLFNQFHDILAGTSIRKAYEDVWADLAVASATAGAVEGAALTALEARLAVPAAAGQQVVGQQMRAWNTLPWPRSGVLRFKVVLPPNQRNVQADPGGLSNALGENGSLPIGRPVLRDAAGQQYPCQLTDVEFDDDDYQASVVAEVPTPALGARTFNITFEGRDLPPRAGGVVRADQIENAHYRVRLDQSGHIVSLYDKAAGHEHLAYPAAVPLVVDDPSDTWSHGVDAFRDVVGQFVASEPAELLEDGPVAKTLRVRMAWGQSRLTQEITLYGQSMAVDVRLTVDWHEQHKMLKLAFPLAISDARATASAPYGWVERAANGEEEPCQAWVDLSGQTDKGVAGLCLVQDSKYGYDALGNELRLSVLRSPVYAFDAPRQVPKGVTYHYTDQGEQVLNLRLLPHLGDWRAARPDRQAYALLEPCMVRPVAAQQGAAPQDSLLSVDAPNVVVSTVKLAEGSAGKRLLVRGYETDGKKTTITLVSEALGQSWRHMVRPFEIWTLALPLDGGAPVALNLLEEA